MSDETIVWTVHSSICTECGWESGEFDLQAEADFAAQAHVENAHNIERVTFIDEVA